MSSYATPLEPAQPGHTVQGPSTSRSRSSMALASLIISVIALIGVIGLAAWLAVSGMFSGPGMGPLTGQLRDISSGSTVRGADLENEVTAIIADDGGDVSEMRCPDTSSVGQGVVTVCHGSISGDPWAVVVFFEDSQGRFTLQPL